MPQVNVGDYAYVTSYTPARLAAISAGLRAQLKGSIIGIGINAVVLLLFWFLWGRDSAWYKWVLIIQGGLTLLLVLVTALRYWRTSRIVKRVPGGPAIRVDPLGLVLAEAEGPVRVPWANVAHIGAKAHIPLPGPELVIERTGQAAWKVPLMYLDKLPGSLDSAIRAHTSDSYSIDLSRLDRII